MGGLFLLMLLAPIAAGVLGMIVVRPRTSGQGLATTANALALLIFAIWFLGRADEKPIEGVVALTGCVVSVAVLSRIFNVARRREEG